MARIVGGLTTSHIPAIGNAIHKNLFEDPYWKPFFDGYPPAREWLAEVKPDIAIVIYNDHGLNFFLDKQPTFAFGAAPQYTNEDEGWGIPVIPPFKGDPAFSWHLINSVVHEDFDLVTCQEMAVDHGFSVPMQLYWPNFTYTDIATVPVMINTVQHPLPSPARCYKLGQAIGRAVASYPEDKKVVVIGTGGLSHQLDGERAGFINKEFDLTCMEKIVDDPAYFLEYSIHDLVRLAGAQGAEFILWLTMRGALGGKVKQLYSNYHIPISNTAAGTMVLEAAE
ncbi:class III extradiol dioxygenase family protein [Rhodospirillum sp. A1_3_36]|uniref:class III extradiol dioxygenase family protein n=1 Tax=Rhodospirillum sp. A1_3_36 TaxID=3391666 RepID=UPI0039A465BC